MPTGEEVGADELKGQEAHARASADPADEGFKGFGDDAGRVEVGASQLDAHVLYVHTQLRHELAVTLLLLKGLEASANDGNVIIVVVVVVVVVVVAVVVASAAAAAAC